jgi:transcriptional regulator with XRE-family HTH domain
VVVRQEFSGRALRARRRELGLSRDFIAFSIGVVTDTVGNWERGFCTPRGTETLTKLADALECDVQDLFEAVGAHA